MNDHSRRADFRVGPRSTSFSFLLLAVGAIRLCTLVSRSAIRGQCFFDQMDKICVLRYSVLMLNPGTLKVQGLSACSYARYAYFFLPLPGPKECFIYTLVSRRIEDSTTVEADFPSASGSTWLLHSIERRLLLKSTHNLLKTSSN